MAQCVVSGVVVNLIGQALARSVVAFRLDQTPNDVVFTTAGAVAHDELVEYTDEFGRFAVSLPQGQRMILRIDDLGLHRQVRVPAQAVATLEELLDADV